MSKVLCIRKATKKTDSNTTKTYYIATLDEIGVDTKTYRSISYNVQGATLSNNSSVVEDGKQFATTIYPNYSDYSIEVSVTMGGSDVTSNCFEGNTISISSVTGDVSIAVNCVANSSGGDSGNTEPEEDASILYQLSEPLVCDGTSTYIDTGVKLRDSNKSFSIAVNFTNGNVGNTSNRYVILHDMYEVSPWPGVCVQLYTVGGASEPGTSLTACMNTSVQSANVMLQSASSTGDYILTGASRTVKCVISYNSETNETVMALSRDGLTKYKTISAVEYQSASECDETTLLGCYQTSDGTKGRFYLGTINDCTIRNRPLTEDEISEYLA